MSLPGHTSALAAFAGGASGGITITLSPGDQSTGGASTSYTFTAEIAVPSSGTPSSYTWAASGFPGTWSVLAGQGTSTATIRVTGVISGDTAEGIVSCAVVIGGTTYYGSANLTYSHF